MLSSNSTIRVSSTRPETEGFLLSVRYLRAVSSFVRLLTGLSALQATRDGTITQLYCSSLEGLVSALHSPSSSTCACAWQAETDAS